MGAADAERHADELAAELLDGFGEADAEAQPELDKEKVGRGVEEGTPLELAHNVGSIDPVDAPDADTLADGLAAGLPDCLLEKDGEEVADAEGDNEDSVLTEAHGLLDTALVVEDR